MARYKVFPNNKEDAQKAIADIAVLCKTKEPGLQMYVFFFNTGRTELIGIEAHRSNEAILNHPTITEGLQMRS